MSPAAAAAVLVFAQVASAHPGHGAGGFNAGAQHPFSGWDHILAMVAVGLCAAQFGGRALWLLPATFLAFMTAGGLVAGSATSVPLVEQGIAASVLVLGLLVATGARLPLALHVGLIGLFAMFHGYAHGAGMQAGTAPVYYGIGFIVATAALHLIGIGAGITMKRSGWSLACRLAGGAIAFAGLMLSYGF